MTQSKEEKPASIVSGDAPVGYVTQADYEALIDEVNAAFLALTDRVAYLEGRRATGTEAPAPPPVSKAMAQQDNVRRRPGWGDAPGPQAGRGVPVGGTLQNVLGTVHPPSRHF